MGDIFLSGQNQCHITGVKKSYFCHTFHLRPKKVFWWVVGGWRVVGGGWKVTLVSVCVHFLKLLDTQTTDTEMDTELDNKKTQLTRLHKIDLKDRGKETIWAIVLFLFLCLFPKSFFQNLIWVLSGSMGSCKNPIPNKAQMRKLYKNYLPDRGKETKSC